MAIISFTQAAQNALNRAMYAAREMGHSYVGSEHILLGLLAEKTSAAAKLLEKHGVAHENARDYMIATLGTGRHQTTVGFNDMTPRTKKMIEMSSMHAVKNGQRYIGTEHILLAMLGETDCEAVKTLGNFGVSAQELEEEITAYLKESGGTAEKAINEQEIGQDAGQKTDYGSDSPALAKSPTLKQYARDLTDMAKKDELDPIIGRESETERVIEILSRRTKNNPCLIGEPGVGKTAVVEGLAQRIASGDIPDTLTGKSIISLDISSMVAGAKYRGEFEERMKSMMNEVKANKDLILFIDEIHTIIGAGAAEGAVDAANILKPALSRGDIQVIGATTIDEYRRHIEKDAALERRFQPVTVGEPTPDEAIAILEGLREKYEEFHKVRITDEALDAAVNLSRRYINDRFLPDKAVDLIDEASAKKRIAAATMPPDLRRSRRRHEEITAEKDLAIKEQDYEKAAALRDEENKLEEEYLSKYEEWKRAHSDGDTVVSADDIADVVTGWTGIPVKKLEAEEGEKLARLEELLHRRIVGQDEAVSAVSKAIRRGRVGLKDPKRPTGSFIFLGPTGVGKTELSKALAEILFGDESAIIRIDMSEYMEKHSVSKMIGSPPGYVGYDEGGQLTERIRRRPYSVVLFDEIEKAHPDVFNIMLQILDDGVLTDSQGRKVDFRNTVIIMTSNIGAKNYFDRSRPLGFSDEPVGKSEKDQLHDKLIAALKETFRPEFLNRVDEIIIFDRLGEEEIKQIASHMLNGIKERIASIGVDISFGDDVVALLAKEGMDPVWGARPLRREITRRVEDTFSTAMLEQRIKEGDIVTASVENGEIVYSAAAKTEEEPALAGISSEVTE
ncbi:MAG: ATP-dependent Clp protease ATP-binding subunit [Clostridiales bacterium]|nr:ATP-dependent Clp protease ATP-binding subunit [Clostridiales bacterium]